MNYKRAYRRLISLTRKIISFDLQPRWRLHLKPQSTNTFTHASER